MASSPKKLCTSGVGNGKDHHHHHHRASAVVSKEVVPAEEDDRPAAGAAEAAAAEVLEARRVKKGAKDRAVVVPEDHGDENGTGLDGGDVEEDSDDDFDDEDDEDDEDDDSSSSGSGNESDSEGESGEEGAQGSNDGEDGPRPRKQDKARRLKASRATRAARTARTAGSRAPREIQVEFEARAPRRQDYFGVLNLLKPMLTPATSFPFPDLTNAILEQRFLGSVITKAYEPGDDDSTTTDEDDVPATAAASGAAAVSDPADRSPGNLCNNGGGPKSAPEAGGDEGEAHVGNTPNNHHPHHHHHSRTNSESRSRTTSSSSGSATVGGSLVLGLGTILRLVRGTKVSDSVVKHVVGRCEVADPSKAATLSAFLADESHNLGFLISERIINMPPQISSPLYETLLAELRRASGELKMPSFKFTHFMLISRILATPDNSVRIFTNSEEELFMPESQLVCQLYDQRRHADLNGVGSGSGGTANSSRPSHEQVILEPQQRHSHPTDEMVEQRLLMIFEASKLSAVRAKIDSCFPA